ncbi:MAG: hypothetical protein JO302_01970 [Candidatus Eremiobacteraeota bacterium]|nr:hypothetical protein [Candidatus Eremiobacteraeota bacterium]
MAAVLLFALAGGCSSTSAGAPPAGFLPSRSQSNPSQVALYVYGDTRDAFVASYTLPASGHVAPRSVTRGSATELRESHGGIALGPDGRLYVLENNPEALLVFAPNVSGNRKPERTALLPHGLYSGFALDPHGNFWTAEQTSRALERFSLAGHGVLQPSLVIATRMATPIGRLRAAPTTVAVRGSDVYCECVVLHGGAQAIGITEYHVSVRNAVSIVRTFFDFLSPPLPELPPSMLHVDAHSGTMYAAGILEGYGVFAYAAGTPSGSAHHRRTIFGTATGLLHIESLTTDDQGRLYVATPKAVDVFASNADGDVPPLFSISDPDLLRYKADQFGDFLVIR